VARTLIFDCSASVTLASLLLCGALVSGEARGGLLAVDLHAAGDGLITRDVESGLDWLDLTRFQGTPWGQIESALASVPEFSGFRFALREEVEALAQHAGVTLPSYFPRSENFAPVTHLIALLGSTFTASPQGDHYSCGVLSNLSGQGGGVFGITRNTACLVASADGGQVIPSYDSQLSTEPRQFTGSWLVREISEHDTIGEPTALALVSLGLACMRLRRRNRDS